MQRVAGAIRGQPAQHGPADQGEISQQIEDLVADKLVGIAQRGFVQHAAFGKHDGILQRAAPDQAAGLQRFHLVEETEGAGRRNRAAVVFRRELELQLLVPDQRMREPDLVLDRESRSRIDRQRLALLFERERLGDPHIVARRGKLDHAHPLEGFGIGQSAAVQYRDLEVVEFDVGVVHPEGIERRQQMFDGGDPHAAVHQRRRVGNPLHRADIRAQFEVVQIHTPEDDSFAGGRRHHAHGGVFARVQAHAAEFDWSRQCLLAHQLLAGNRGPIAASTNLTKPNAPENVYICPHLLFSWSRPC
jgi:hypothetical protein